MVGTVRAEKNEANCRRSCRRRVENDGQTKSSLKIRGFALACFVSSITQRSCVASAIHQRFHYTEQLTIAYLRFLDISLIWFWRFRWCGDWQTSTAYVQTSHHKDFNFQFSVGTNKSPSPLRSKSVEHCRFGVITVIHLDHTKLPDIMSKQQEEDLPEPPPDYPRSYRKVITEGKYAGRRIECTLCERAIEPEKIDRHENGESELHNRNLAERYAEEQRQKRDQERERKRKRKLEQERREREQKRQREQELERESERLRQIEAGRKRDVEALDSELEQQNSSDEAIEIFSSSSSSSSLSSSSSSDGGSDAKISSDDDSDVQLVLPPSKPLNDPQTSSKRPEKLRGISNISKGKNKNLWRARISVLGKNRSIGCFKSPEAAAAAYQLVRNALDDSGLPSKDKGLHAVFDSAKEKAKEVATMGFSGT